MFARRKSLLWFVGLPMCPWDDDPDAGGGDPNAGDETTTEELKLPEGKFTFNGKEYTAKEFLEENKNYGKLNSQVTQLNQELGEVKGRVKEQSEQLQQQQQQQPPVDQRGDPEETRPDFEKMYREIDVYGDPEGQKKWEDVRRQEIEWDQKEKQKDRQEMLEEVESRVDAGQRQVQIDLYNKELIDDYLAKNDIKLEPGERQELEKIRDGLRGEGDYGFDRFNQKSILFTDQATEHALMLLKPYQERRLAAEKAAARDEALGNRRTQPNSSDNGNPNPEQQTDLSPRAAKLMADVDSGALQGAALDAELNKIQRESPEEWKSLMKEFSIPA